jgi:hypothetical protein
MQKKIPQGTRADRQMRRSNSITFGLQAYNMHNDYSTTQSEAPESSYERERNYKFSRAASQSGFDIITEESQPDTEM